MSIAGMRLLRLAHSILGHPVLVLCCCARVSGLLAAGSLGSVAGLPWSCCVLVLVDPVILDLHR